MADSACTATAYLGGVKGNYATIGVSAAVELNDCAAQNNSLHHVHSIAEWAQARGMLTGLITTTAVTHASPAGIYAHAANRNWESDAEVLANNGNPELCSDIASQLINGRVGQNLNVILGGGRSNFLSQNEKDEQNIAGKRLDGQNLIKKWQQLNGNSGYYAATRKELLQTPKNISKILGLFAANHLPYHLDDQDHEAPSLQEMVKVALDLLESQNNTNGYFLFVEGGRIDHAHHDTMAMKALDETAEFDKAIHAARSCTSLKDTLVLVTSDHSHTMSVAGYSSRKNDIFGINNAQLAADLLPYSTLSYANGPGFADNVFNQNGATKRKNLKLINMKRKDYKFPTMVPLESETHGGDDVAVFASGPYAHLFTGVYEQNFIPHALGYAACLGGRKTACSIKDIKDLRS